MLTRVHTAEGEPYATPPGTGPIVDWAANTHVSPPVGPPMPPARVQSFCSLGVTSLWAAWAELMLGLLKLWQPGFCSDAKNQTHTGAHKVSLTPSECPHVARVSEPRGPCRAVTHLRLRVAPFVAVIVVKVGKVLRGKCLICEETEAVVRCGPRRPVPNSQSSDAPVIAECDGNSGAVKATRVFLPGGWGRA